MVSCAGCYAGCIAMVLSLMSIVSGETSFVEILSSYLRRQPTSSLIYSKVFYIVARLFSFLLLPFFNIWCSLSSGGRSRHPVTFSLTVAYRQSARSCARGALWTDSSTFITSFPCSSSLLLSRQHHSSWSGSLCLFIRWLLGGRLDS